MMNARERLERAYGGLQNDREGDQKCQIVGADCRRQRGYGEAPRERRPSNHGLNRLVWPAAQRGRDEDE
jgi:hypothetical protein